MWEHDWDHVDYTIQPKDEGDRAYQEGLDARAAGKGRDENPYRLGTENEDQWDTGWSDGDEQ